MSKKAGPTAQWLTQEKPDDGTWCWVTDGKSTWPAKRSQASGGGWTNGDTWEDWDHAVVAWIPLVLPNAPEITPGDASARSTE
jgi:hypothetical protein